MIDFFKMDIEGSEWEVLQSFLSSPEAYDLVTKRVRQIALEIHTEELQVSSARQYLEKLNGFEQKLGFRRWSFGVNPYCGYVHLGKARSKCYEMVYLNKQFIRKQDLKS
jgi:Methyltransferase FkbM domain